MLLDHGAAYDFFSACGLDDLAHVKTLIGSTPGAIALAHRGEADMTGLHWAARAGSNQCGAPVDAETRRRRSTSPWSGITATRFGR